MVDVSRLPGPIMEIWEWWFAGACRTRDSRLFFHPEEERAPARRARDAAAIAICTTCPVIRECRAHALAVREPYGVWGGLTNREREDIYCSVLTERSSAATPSTRRPGEADHDPLSSEPVSAPAARRGLTLVERA